MDNKGKRPLSPAQRAAVRLRIAKRAMDDPEFAKKVQEAIEAARTKE